MRGSSTAWARGVAALTALLIVLTFGAPPCDASDPSPATTPKASQNEKQSLTASAAAQVAAMAPPPRALSQDPAAGASTGESRSFFRSPKGVAAIALMVAGAVYVAYSIPKDYDKVHSPIR